MATHCGYITKLKNVRPHPNADRFQLAEVFGNTVCVNLDYYEGQVVVYFPTDLQLSVEFCEVNHLCRTKPDGTPDTGYMDASKRNVTAIRLRGEKSDGLALPISCLESFGDITNLKIGDTIDVFNGHNICQKYIPRINPNKSYNYKSGSGKPTKKKINIAPTFHEHVDTEQLNYNLGAFKSGDEIEITLKMHGTSQRTAYTKVLQEDTFVFDSVIKAAIHKMIPKKDWRLAFGNKFGKPYYDWGYVSGTRRTVLEDYEGGYYGSNEFREQHSKTFEGKLHKGESVYYEVVGFTNTGTPIMATCNNKKLNDKEFIKQYGETTTFSYGCSPTGEGKPIDYWDEDKTEPCTVPILPISDIYVYRMTMTNEDGVEVDYSPDYMRFRCEQMGVKTVPVLWRGTIPQNPASADDPTITAGEWIKNVAERYYDGPDPSGKTHVREGVVVRIINAPGFVAYKTKNYNFKMLSGIIVEDISNSNIEMDEEILAEL